MIDYTNLPGAGFDGTHTGTCIACLTPTDTAFGLEGVWQFHATILTKLGMTLRESLAVIELTHGEFPDADDDTRFTSIYRCCTACAKSHDVPAPGLAIPEHCPLYSYASN